MIRVVESNMIFEFEEKHIFQIENSNLHSSLGDGIKTVEFVVSVKPDEILFVEA